MPTQPSIKRSPRMLASRKSEEVYTILRKRIVLSDINDNQTITEMEIATATGCSQSTVREALLRLQEEGLVVRKAYRGSVVSPISINEAQAFLKLRAQLESEALVHSLPLVDASHIAELSDLVRAMEALAAAGDEYGLFELDQRFHTRLFELAQMPALVPVLIRCSLYNHRNKISLVNAPRTLQETAQRHWSIVHALQRGDVVGAQKVLQHHIKSVAGNTDEEFEAKDQPELDPHQRVLFERVAREDAGLPVITELPRQEALRQFEKVNARWNGVPLTSFDVEHFDIPGLVCSDAPARRIPVVEIRHRGTHDPSRGQLIYLHGGGWAFGNMRTHMGAMSRLAELTGCRVLGVDYALAPDHPFPVGLNECTWAWRWLRSSLAHSGPWSISGDSAGANLALAMMLDLKALGEPLPHLALLFYGVYSSDHGTESHRRCGSGRFGLSSQRMTWYREQYLAGTSHAANDPRVSPLNGDLEGLPPLFLNAAGLDPLHDDTTALVKKLSKTSTPFEFHRYEGVVHGFMQMASELPQAKRAFEDAAMFLRARQPAE